MRTCLDRSAWQTLTPGAAVPLSPKDPLAGLSARLSAKDVILGTFSYPDSGPYTESRRWRGRRGKR